MLFDITIDEAVIATSGDLDLAVAVEISRDKLCYIAAGRQRAQDVALGVNNAHHAALGAYHYRRRAVAIEVGDDLALQPTLSRFQNSITRTDLGAMAEILVDVFFEQHAEAAPVDSSIRPFSNPTKVTECP